MAKLQVATGGDDRIGEPSAPILSEELLDQPADSCGTVAYTSTDLSGYLRIELSMMKGVGAFCDAILHKAPTAPVCLNPEPATAI